MQMKAEKKEQRNNSRGNTKKKKTKIEDLGNSLVVQWLGLCTFTAKGPGSIPGRGTKILQDTQHSQKNKIK